jgi:glycosyltransferase involved in cell wall biosynthesis
VAEPLTLSIAMCTYNGERFLREQLDSFLSQTRLPDELVVCDDGSRDRSGEILTQFASEAPFPVRIVINQENLGFGKNFEQAISLCQGDVIFLSDQDDYWLPNKISLMAEVFNQFPQAGLCFSDALLVDENLDSLKKMIWGKYGFHWKTLQILPPRFLTYYFLKGGGIWGCSLAIRRSLRDEIFPIPPCWNHDAWITFLSSTITSIIALPESLIKYRQHSLQYIGVKPSRPLNNIHLIKALKRKNYHVTANLWKIALQRILTDKSNHASPVLLLEIENKIKFMEDRALIAKSKITRLPLILRDLFKGNYNIYSEYPAKAVITDMLYI